MPRVRRPAAASPAAAPPRWTYEAAVRHLLSFVNYEALAGRRKMQRNPGDLERFRRALGKLDHPELAAPALHVAGTNGKGSTAVMAAAILTAEGVRTGLYTSPHLLEMRERIRLNGVPISRSDFATFAREAAAAVGGEPAEGFRTTFELLTALAFLAFRARGVDAMVVEVGLGGRLDSTNVLAPRTAAITSISLDHTEVLGSTEAEIAADKAGIIKRGMDVVVARQSPGVLKILEQRARRVGARLARVDDVEVSAVGLTGAGESFDLKTPLAGYPGLVLALRGTHQIENAALAVRAVELFLGRAPRLENVRRALRRVRWPGRFEILSRRPPLVVDGAHNPGGVARLTLALERYFPGRPVVFVIGLSAGKDASRMLEGLRGKATGLIAVAAAHPRALGADQVAAAARTVVKAPVETARTITAGLIRARRLAGEQGIVCVAGSLYLVGDTLGLWRSFRRQWAGDVPKAAAKS